MEIILYLRWPVQRLLEVVWFFTNPMERSLVSFVALVMDVCITIVGLWVGVSINSMGIEATKPYILALLYILGILVGTVIGMVSDWENEKFDEGDLESLLDTRSSIIVFLVSRIQWVLIGIAIIVALN